MGEEAEEEEADRLRFVGPGDMEEALLSDTPQEMEDATLENGAIEDEEVSKRGLISFGGVGGKEGASLFTILITEEEEGGG